MTRRIFFALLTLWWVITLAFLVLRTLPGDALGAQMELGGASRADIDQARTALGLNAPIHVQYIGYWAGLLRGDMGISLTRLLPVQELIGQRLMPTALLALFAMSLAVIWGITIGMMASSHGVWRVIGRMGIAIALGTPIYWTGTLAIMAFSTYLPIAV